VSGVERSARPLDVERARAGVKAAFDAVKADDVAIRLRASERGYVRYAAGQVTTSGVVSDVVAAVTCAVGGRHATAEVHSAEPALLAEAARRALAMAELTPPDPERP
jgi:predicted Zn-dependent protease